MNDWYDYVSKKMAPKPSHQRPMPVQRRAPAPPEQESQGIQVEENAESDSMIVRIIGKLRGS